MSLKFGIYLVEQRIISPEQFCGLVTIQQEASMSMATIAIRKNFMTIKQVAMVLDIAESHPEKSFISIALEQDLIDRADADQMLHFQQISSPSIRKLVVECGLLTQRQTAVLFMHFEKQSTASPAPVQREPQPQPEVVINQPAPQVEATQHPGLRQPKFQQHPIVTRQSTPNPANG